MKSYKVTPYQTVNTLKGKCPGVFYQTTKYGLFKNTKTNRGEENGIVESKVKKLIKIILAGLFIPKLQHIMVNLKGEIIDGHHRFEALKRLGMPIYFVLYDADEVNNKSQLEVTKILILINSIDPRWNGPQKFRAAVENDIEIALEIDLIINETIEKIDGLDKRSFTPSKVIGILRHDPQYLHGNQLTIEDFEDEELLDRIRSKEFRSDIAFMGAVMGLLANDRKCVAEKRNVVQYLFKAIWNPDIGISKEKAYTYIFRKGFKCAFNDADSINDRIREIANTTIRKKISWE